MTTATDASPQCNLCNMFNNADNDVFHSECPSCIHAARTNPTELCAFCRHLRLRHLMYCVHRVKPIKLDCNLRGLAERSSTCQLCLFLELSISKQINLVYQSPNKDYTTRNIWLSVESRDASTMSWRLEPTTDEILFKLFLYRGQFQIVPLSNPRPQTSFTTLVEWQNISNWPEVVSKPLADSSQVSDYHDVENFRVIHVSEYCVVPTPKTCKYVSLSYVWGESSSKPFQSTLASIASLAVPGALRTSHLPRTISDAIEACTKLGYQYLWVDALCIVQDDFENKQAQINRMHEIYHNAALCLVAAAGLDSNHGLPGVTRPRRWTQTFGLIHNMRLCAQLENAHLCTFGDKWATRGWTYQEFCLSQRLLFFTESGLFFFDCTPENQVERNPRYLTDQPACVDDSAPGEYYMGSNFMTALWTYSDRQLTFPNDFLNAFLGVLNQKFPKGHAYGLPFEAFDQTILWSCLDFTSLPRISDAETILPSWSWISASGSIKISTGSEYGVAVWAMPYKGHDLVFMQPGPASTYSGPRRDWADSYDRALFAWALGCIPGICPARLENDMLNASQAEAAKIRWEVHNDFWMEAFGPTIINLPFSTDEITDVQMPGRLLVFTQEALLRISLNEEDDDERAPGRRMIKILDDSGRCIGAVYVSTCIVDRFFTNCAKTARLIALSVSWAMDALSEMLGNNDRTAVDVEFFRQYNSTIDATFSSKPPEQYPSEIYFRNVDGSPAKLAVMNVMLVVPTQTDNEQIVRRVGIGQVFLKKWGGVKRVFKTLILE